jgi:hypothetical protein
MQKAIGQHSGSALRAKQLFPSEGIKNSDHRISEKGGVISWLLLFQRMTPETQLKGIERAAAFDKLAKEAAQLARVTGDTARATNILDKALSKIGASDREIEQVAKAFDKETQAIQRAAEAARELAQAKQRAPPKPSPTGERVLTCEKGCYPACFMVQYSYR